MLPPIFVSLVLLGACSCSSLKKLPPQPVEHALEPAAAGGLAEVSARVATLRGAGQSGFSLLDSADEAMLWRLALADHATTSIDAQYFLWQDDTAGRLLFDRLLKAADRGVEVRLLVDDLALASKDRNLAALCLHPNLDIRIYNPNYLRGSFVAWLFEFAVRFKELNRRMHNKTFIADGTMAVMGGRNIGDEYFGLSKKYNFVDLDVLVAGAVVPDISAGFDTYWNNEISYPGGEMSRRVRSSDLARVRAEFDRDMAEKRELLSQTPYPYAVRDWSDRLRRLPSQMHFGTAKVLQDQPAPDDGGDEIRLVDAIAQSGEPPRSKLLVTSPYLIPVDGMLDGLRELDTDGVDVQLLTGSLGSNNHTVAHSHYKKYRRPILKTGTGLTEFKHEPTPEVRALADVAPVRSKFISLHGKAMSSDGRNCFIGSLNLDPRAVIINAENGLLVRSPSLCKELDGVIEGLMSPDNAWRVGRDERGRLRWEASEGSRNTQPGRAFGQRIGDFFFQLLPIESQL